MKRIFALILALVMVLCITACGGSGNADAEIGGGGAQSGSVDMGETKEETKEETVDEGVFSFTYEGVELVPGAAFDASVLPEADSVFTVPSCAIEGTDNVYSYGTFEVTAYDEGNGEHIYSIYFVDANITTNEGLAVGDTKDKVIEIYGDNFTDNNGECTYKKGDTLLVIVFQNDTVLSIDFRLDV